MAKQREPKAQYKARAKALIPDRLSEELRNRQERRAWREERRRRNGYGGSGGE